MADFGCRLLNGGFGCGVEILGIGGIRYADSKAISTQTVYVSGRDEPICLKVVLISPVQDRAHVYGQATEAGVSEGQVIVSEVELKEQFCHWLLMAPETKSNDWDIPEIKCDGDD